MSHMAMLGERGVRPRQEVLESRGDKRPAGERRPQRGVL